MLLFTKVIVLFLIFNSKIVSSQLFVPNYDIVSEKIEVVNDISEFYFLRADVTKDPRYPMPVLNVRLNITSTIVDQWKVWIETHEKSSPDGVYKKSAISISTSFCQFLSGKYVFNKDFPKHGNFGVCPVEPGIRYLEDFYFTPSSLPPEVPGTYWRLDFRFGLDKDKMNPKRLVYYRYYCYIDRSKKRASRN